MPRPWARLQTTSHRHLIQGSAVLVVGAAVQAVTGGVFWLLAARAESADDVGVATALFTSVLFVSYATSLGLPVVLARYAGGSDLDSHVVFGWGLLTTTAASGIGALAYLAVVDADATRAVADWSTVGGPLLFVAMVVGSSYSLIVDVRWMTQRRWGLVLTRIATSGLLRFPLLVAVPDRHAGLWLFVYAMGPTSISGVLGAVTLPRITGDRHRLRPRPAAAARAVRYAVVNYASQLAYQAPSFILPVVVLVNVAADVNASFYVAWGITAIAFYVPMAIGQALLAEGGRDGSSLVGQVRLALGLAVGLMVVATGVAFLVRDLIVTVYGDDYANAGRILPVLVAASIPWAFTSVFLTEARVRHRNAATVAITVVLSVGVIGPSLVWVPNDGLDGASAAYVTGNVLAAFVSAAVHLTGRHRPVPAPEAEPPLGPLPADTLSPTTP